MRRPLLCGSSLLLFLTTVAACAPDYYNRGYYGYGPYGAQSYGYGSYGAAPYTAAPYGGAPYAAGPYGAAPYAAGPYGGAPYGAAPYAGAPYAAGPYRAGQYMAPASYAAPQALSRASYDFVTNAALSDLYEIQAGNLARSRGTSPAVRQFADRMVRDHTVTSQQMMATLQGNGTPILTPQALDPRHQSMVAELQTAQGADFDRRYAMQQVMAHREAVNLLQNYAQTGDNPALKQLAQQTLPMVQDHLRTAQTLPGAAG
jgi:putative membrane protein